MYTAPAYFMSAVVIATIVLLRLYFRDRVRYGTQIEARKSKKREAIDDHANAMTCIGLSIYDCCILGCMALNVSTKGSIASFETMGISMAESHFDMASARAGTIVASCGTVGVISLLSMGHLAHFFSDIQLICGGMIVMAAGIVSLTTLDDEGGNSSWRFILAIFLIYAVGYPIGHTAVIGLFSKSKWSERNALNLNEFCLMNCELRSCGETTPRRALGLVCFCRILGATCFPDRVRLHCYLRGHHNALFWPDWNSDCIDGDFSVLSTNPNLPF
jgi:hypothetical protein